MRKNLIVVWSIAVIFWIPNYIASAQPLNAVQQNSPGAVVGTVVSIDPTYGVLSIRDDQGKVTTLNISNAVIVDASGETVDIFQIRGNDSIEISMGNGGQIQKVVIKE